MRRTVWGEQQGEQAMTEDDMGNTHLGDVNHPPAVVYPPQQSSPVAMLLLTAAMAAGIPTAGLVGYILATKAPAASNAFDDETVTIGLGKEGEQK